MPNVTVFDKSRRTWYTLFSKILETMLFQKILAPAQIVLPLLLITAILLQAKGSGLGAAFGGEGTIFRSKRGIEKKLFQTTILLALLFFGTSFASVYFK